MPVKMLRTFRFDCDHCRRVGPTFREREELVQPLLYLPDGWVAYRKRGKNEILYACSQCADAVSGDQGFTVVRDGRKRDDHEQ